MKNIMKQIGLGIVVLLALFMILGNIGNVMMIVMHKDVVNYNMNRYGED